MSCKRLVVSSLMIVIMVFALATVPNSCKRAYELGTGGAFNNIIESENLQWDQMSDAERAPYIAQAKRSGFQLSIYTLLGQYIPFYLFIAITIGLLSRPTSRSLRAFLWISILLIWLVGCFFLSLYSKHWGNYWGNHPYSVALGSALIIYIAVAIFFGIIIGIGRLYQYFFRGEMNTNKVCGKFPDYCYKAFKCKEHAEDFISQGTFRMGCQLSYTAMENEQLCDTTEGGALTREFGRINCYGFSKDPNEKPIYMQKMDYQNNHIESGNARFCFCTCLPKVKRQHVKNNIGKYIVKINDPRKLAEDINDYFFRDNQKVLVVGFYVVYNKGEKLEGKLRDNERLDLAYKQKPKSFSHDCEFRIVAIKLGKVCDGECKFFDGPSERDDPECKYIKIELGKKLDYLSFVT